MPISNQKEKIDIRILRLIGLEDVFDLDYETYATLLKEAMIKGRMAKTAIPTEEVMLLTDEYKRIRTKKGRFEVKKNNKITSKSFNVGNIKAKISGTKPKALPETVIGVSPTSKSLENNISAITASFVSILDTLKKQKKVDAAENEYERRKVEREKRSLTESKLEKRFEGLKKAAEKIIAPVKSLLDRILEFFTTVILGRIVYKLVDWMGNPENASKVKSIIRFLGDWWPALLGSYILFGTTFGKFVRGTIGMLGRFIFQIGRVAIPQLLRFIKSPLGIGAGLFAAGAVVPAMFPQTVNEQEKKTASTSGSNEDKIKALLQQKSNLSFFDKLQGKGSEIDEQISYLKTGKTKSYGFNNGGFVNGFVSGEKGIDKVPAMLSDGEFVMSRGAVEKYGVDTLEAMNAAGGGTNRPRVVQGVSYAAGGGLIGNIGDPMKFSKNPLMQIDRFLDNLFGRNIDISKPSTWPPKGVLESILNQGVSTGSQIFNQGVKAQSYLQNGGLEKDISKLMQSGTQFGAGLYDQALKVGNKALLDIQSGKTQDRLIRGANQLGKRIKDMPEKAAGGFFDYMKNMSSSKLYQENARRMEKMQDKMITFGDKFVKQLPDGPFKEMADKGLIPIPSGNATWMRNLTFAKAMLGPLGRPFKILSNKEVDEMRRKTIEKTMGKNGLIVDPKTGEVRMNWNQEDINKGAKGGGAYTDDLGPRGPAFNSILGRFSASTEGKGNTLYTDDRYNFNKTVSEYAELAKQGLMKGSMSDATYFGASMLGRFAQDIGWLNQRALGSRIKVGDINRKRIDPKTGKVMTAKQAEYKSKQDFLKKNPGVTLYDKPKPVSKDTPYKSRFARPKNAGVKPVDPPVKRSPKVITAPSKTAGGGMNGGRSSRPKTPSFSATTGGSSSKAKTLGITR